MLQLLLVLLLPTSLCTAQNTIRVGSWNVANRPNNDGDNSNFATVIGALGASTRPAIMALQETDSASSLEIRNIFNSVYSASSFAVTTSASDGGGDRTGFVYDTRVVSLLSEETLTTGFTHNLLRSTFQPLGTGMLDPITVYSVHLKSGSSSSDIAKRREEAANLQANAALLCESNLLFAGDFNALSSMELENLDAIDVAAAPGYWRDDSAFLSLHTQSPSAAVDDRFDLHLTSDELMDGRGWDFVADSFTVLGNNGTHSLNQSIDTGTGASPEVLAALMGASDHLPIYSDFIFIAVPEPSGAIPLLMFSAIAAIRRKRS